MQADPQLRFLPQFIALARHMLQPQQIILFGSRARGDHTRTSDVDLALRVSEAATSHWPRFVAEAEEHVRTLLKLDLVRLDRTSDAMRQSIAEEGLLIYDQENLD
jgi:uncharacterized protein